MSDEHYGSCVWTAGSSYSARTPYGAIQMFGEDGQRAVEVMLLSAAACLNFYLAEYVQARKLPVERLEVRCVGDVAQRPERVSYIHTHVTIDGKLSDRDAQRMVSICERACKVMNTLRTPPKCSVDIHNRVDANTTVATHDSGKQR